MSTFRPEYFDMFDSSILLERELALLLQSENRWFTTEEINQVLGVKYNTTLRIVNRLEEDLLEMGDDNLALVVSKGKGFFLQRNLDSSVTPFISYIFSKTQIIKMIKAIFSGEFGTVKKYAQDYYISEATVRRYLIRIRKFFSRYNIQVKRETAELEGDESKISMLMLLTYWRLYTGVKWPFTTINEQSIMKLVEELISKTDYMNVSLTTKRRLAYYFAVTILRTRKGNFVEIDFQNYAHLLEDDHYRTFEKSLMNFKGDINTLYGEIPFHYEVWKTNPYFYKRKERIQSYYELEKQKQTPVFQAVELMVKEFQKEFF
ncbi:MAG: helix-turn-helix domain-containing protein [Enterococcus lacertideformus]|uniref:Helix-turn-helix domain-containing protein n=1 Tax=Enterococcus lacertideformus TaxID=2771493 RepID=A0A931AUE8_9ENTE|nr:helix-turn-helix domain-containing protein [Enterococcus lacertideformus]